jgi:hypothetical protein
MTDTRTQIVGMTDIRRRKPRVPLRSRLGRTWQDENWRRKLVEKLAEQIPPHVFSANLTGRTSHRA